MQAGAPDMHPAFGQEGGLRRVEPRLLRSIHVADSE